MTGIEFNPENDIPDLSGKVILVTGGNAGLGKVSILALAKHSPERIFLTGRNPEKCTAAIDDIHKSVPNAAITFLQCDLASLASVQEAAKQFIGQSNRLDILMCNAGIMASPPGLSTDGYEIQFATNHLGHALLIKLLLPTLLQTAQQPGSDVRIISSASLGAFLHPKRGIDFKNLRTTQECAVGGGWIRYGQSKVANILYAAELARRYPDITSVSIHPGVIETGLVSNQGFWNRALVHVSNYGKMSTPEEGSRNQLWAATGSKDGMTSGAFYEPIGAPGKKDKKSTSEDLAKQLWDWTQKELEAYQV